MVFKFKEFLEINESNILSRFFKINKKEKTNFEQNKPAQKIEDKQPETKDPQPENKEQLKGLKKDQFEYLKKCSCDDNYKIDQQVEPADTQDLPIQPGDIVTCINFDGLTNKQLNFINSQKIFKVYKICNSKGDVYTGDTPFIDIGYNIPLKMERFEKKDVFNEKKYNILFLQYNHKVTTYGEEDVNNYFRGKKNIKEVYEEIFSEKLPDSYLHFADYKDVYKLKKNFYVDDYKLDNFNFVFFGFMYKFTNISKLLVEYCERNNIPHLKYETYDYYHNKAYQFDLLDELGYPYIPSVMTSKITNNILNEVKELGYPVIVKDVYLDRGEGVWTVKDEKELIKFFRFSDKLYLIQKYIPNDGEYRVITIKNKVYLVAKKNAIVSVNKKDIDERKSVKGSLPPEVIKMIEDVSKHLFCDIVGFDIIQDTNTKKYYIIETNASPHYMMFSVVTGVSIPDIISDYIIKKIKL